MNTETAQTIYIDYLKFEKKASPHTIAAYETDLGQFFPFIKQDFEIENLEDISHQIIRSWLVQLMGDGISPRSVNRKITCLHSFFKYHIRLGNIIQNPIQKVQRPKQGKKLPVFIDEQNINDFLNIKTEENDFATQRDQMILLLLYHCGIRRAELVNLKTNDVDLLRGQIKVLGKRNKERIIPILKELQEAIKEYTIAKKEKGYDNEELLCSDKGVMLSTGMVYTKVKFFLSQFTTLQKRSPHVLRHTFATHMLNHGADLNAIKELLGHANLAATQIYTHNTFEKLKAQHKQAHPKG